MYLETNKLLQFGVLLEPLSHAHVPDEVLWALARVHIVLAVVVVGVGTLSALHVRVCMCVCVRMCVYACACACVCGGKCACMCIMYIHLSNIISGRFNFPPNCMAIRECRRI